MEDELKKTLKAQLACSAGTSHGRQYLCDPGARLLNSSVDVKYSSQNILSIQLLKDTVRPVYLFLFQGGGKP